MGIKTTSQQLTAKDLVPILALLGVLVLIFLVWSGLCFQISQINSLRCYKIESPLTVAEREILFGKIFDCTQNTCRMKINLGQGDGLTCFFQSLFANQDLYSKTWLQTFKMYQS